MLFRPERGSFKKFQKYRNFQGVHVFCQTMELLSSVFFFRQINPEKSALGYFE